MEDKDLYWLAGILEGEGYFGYAVISLQMTDRDVVERVAILFGNKHIIESKAKHANYKDSYHCRIHGQPAINLMLKLLPIMGLRRRQKMESVIDRYEKRTNKWSNKRLLSDETIRYIKNNPENLSTKELSVKFNVKRTVISDVKRGKSGKNIVC